MEATPDDEDTATWAGVLGATMDDPTRAGPLVVGTPANTARWPSMKPTERFVADDVTPWSTGCQPSPAPGMYHISTVEAAERSHDTGTSAQLSDEANASLRPGW